MGRELDGAKSQKAVISTKPLKKPMLNQWKVVGRVFTVNGKLMGRRAAKRHGSAISEEGARQLGTDITSSARAPRSAGAGNCLGLSLSALLRIWNLSGASAALPRRAVCAVTGEGNEERGDGSREVS
eukprot:RCo034234